MPVTRVGDWCSRCLKRPAVHDGICRPCEELRRCFPSSPLVIAAEERAADLSREEFHREVYGWLGREAA